MLQRHDRATYLVAPALQVARGVHARGLEVAFVVEALVGRAPTLEAELGRHVDSAKLRAEFLAHL